MSKGTGNLLSQLIAMLFLLCLAVALSVLVNIYGWGLAPKNWFWIVGIGVGGQMIVQFLIDVIKRSDD